MSEVDEIEEPAPTPKLSFPIVKKVDQDKLRREIAVACKTQLPYIDIFEDHIEVVGMVDESMRSTMQQVIASHDATPSATDAPAVDQINAILAKLVAKGVLTAADAADIRKPKSTP